MKFLPYLGPHYRDSNPRRLLILGHSHYAVGGELDLPGTFTSSVTNLWREGNNQGLGQYMTTIARFITGLEAAELDRPNILNEVAFYNFLTSVMEFPGQIPTLQQCADSHASFLEILTLLNPTHILVTGIIIWQNMPQADGEAGVPDHVGGNLPLKRYITRSGYAIALGIHHPAAPGGNAMAWRPAVEKFLNMQPNGPWPPANAAP